MVIAVQPQEMLLLSACPCAQRGLTRGVLRDRGGGLTAAGSGADRNIECLKDEN